MAQNCSYEIVLKNTAEAIIVPLKNGISSLNGVYDALIKADVNPVTGQCSNYDSIRKLIVQAHQHLQKSEQTASSELKSLDENLEKLVQDEGRLEREMSDTTRILNNLHTEQASNEKLLRDSRGALDQARSHLSSSQHTLHEQEERKEKAKIITGVGAGLFAIPVIGWIAGSAMLIGGGVELDQAQRAVREAEEQVRKSDNDVKHFESKVHDYESRISQTKRDISQKDEKLKQTRDGIQKLKNQFQAVTEFQQKVRSAVQLLGVLSGKASVAEHQTRKFILQEPVMKVMEDVMKAAKEITGNELLYTKDMLKILDQMKQNRKRLLGICASENVGNY